MAGMGWAGLFLFGCANVTLAPVEAQAQSFCSAQKLWIDLNSIVGPPHSEAKPRAKLLSGIRATEKKEGRG